MWADDDSEELPPLVFRDGTFVSLDTKKEIKNDGKGKNMETSNEKKEGTAGKKYVIPHRQPKEKGKKN
jgi:hypothetical protein